MSETIHRPGLDVSDQGTLRQGLHAERYEGDDGYRDATARVCPVCQATVNAVCNTAFTQRATLINCGDEHSEGPCPNVNCNFPGIDALDQLHVLHARHRSILPGSRPNDPDRPYDYCNTCKASWPCSFALVAACLEQMMTKDIDNG